MSKLATAADEYERTQTAQSSRCAVCRLRAHLPEDEAADLNQLLTETRSDGRRRWSGRDLAKLLATVYGAELDVRRGSIDNHRAQGH